MRYFLGLLAIFAAAIVLAVLVRFNAGNVVLFYPPYRVDVSLNFFILVLVSSFVFLLVLVNTIRATLAMPRRVSEYRARRQLLASGRHLLDALKAYLEGRYGRAEKSASRAIESPEYAGLATLLAARAAQRMQQPERRDKWLAESQQYHELRTARLMTTVELLAEENRDADAAMDALSELNAHGIRHAQALRLALRLNQNTRNWPEVLRLVRLLDKHAVLHPTLSRRLRDLAYEALLPQAANDPEALKKLWASVPSTDRIAPAVAVPAAMAFMKIGLQQESAAVLEKALAEDWTASLLKAYRLCAAPEGSATLLAQIDHCEQWLRERPNDAELALSLGTLCLKQKLWGKAQRHLEQTVLGATDRHTLQEAHLRLAQMYEALDQPEAAATHFRLCALATQTALARKAVRA